jgi:hypothetical protein
MTKENTQVGKSKKAARKLDGHDEKQRFKERVAEIANLAKRPPSKHQGS